VPFWLIAVSVPILVLLPWLGPWRNGSGSESAADPDAPDFTALSKSLSQRTCHNALSPTQVAYCAEQLSRKLQSQMTAIGEIAGGAEAMTSTEQDSAACTACAGGCRSRAAQ